MFQTTKQLLICKAHHVCCFNLIMLAFYHHVLLLKIAAGSPDRRVPARAATPRAFRNFLDLAPTWRSQSRLDFSFGKTICV